MKRNAAAALFVFFFFIVLLIAVLSLAPSPKSSQTSEPVTPTAATSMTVGPSQAAICNEKLADRAEILRRSTDNVYYVHSKISIRDQGSTNESGCIIELSFQKGHERYIARWAASSPQITEFTAISIVACQVDDVWRRANGCVLDGIDEGIVTTDDGFTKHRVTAPGLKDCKDTFKSEIQDYGRAVAWTYGVIVNYKVLPLGDMRAPTFVCVLHLDFPKYNGNVAPMLSAEWLLYPNRFENRRVAVSQLACDIDQRRKTDITGPFVPPVLPADPTNVPCVADEKAEISTEDALK